MKEVFTIAVGLAIAGVISTFGLYWIGDRVWGFNGDQCASLSFMGILCGGNLTIYLTRNTRWLFSRPLPEWKFLCATLISQIVGTLVTVYGVGSESFVGIGWKYVSYSWLYLWVSFGIIVLFKEAMYAFLRSKGYHKDFERKL